MRQERLKLTSKVGVCAAEPCSAPAAPGQQEHPNPGSYPSMEKFMAPVRSACAPRENVLLSQRHPGLEQPRPALGPKDLSSTSVNWMEQPTGVGLEICMEAWLP